MDPDSKTFWAYNGYGQPNNAWGTWLGSFQCQPLLQATQNSSVSGRKLLTATTGNDVLNKDDVYLGSTPSFVVPNIAQASSLYSSPAKARAEAMHQEQWSGVPYDGATKSPGGNGCAPGGKCSSAPGCGGS